VFDDELVERLDDDAAMSVMSIEMFLCRMKVICLAQSKEDD
jgi:hypothetical protein